MLQVDLPLFDDVFMQVLSMAPGTLLPVGNGALIEAKGGDNRLRGQPCTSKVSTRVTRSTAVRRR